MTYAVAVVGGSIAGCTTAILFAKRGLRVGLLESNPDPSAYKRICTHFIQPSATPTIQRLAVAEAIEAAGGLRNGIWLWTRWGWIRPGAADAGSAPPYGYNVRRQVLGSTSTRPCCANGWSGSPARLYAPRTGQGG